MKLLPKFISNNKLNKAFFWLAFLGGMSYFLIHNNQEQQFTKTRAFNSDAKSNLQNIYLGCSAFWRKNGEDKNCQIKIISSSEYGFVQSPNVSVSAEGAKATFTAKAQHKNSLTIFTMDAGGNIQ